MDESKQECNKCILPVEYPGISFDRMGICNYCHKWDTKWQQLDFSYQLTLLENILNNYRGRSKPYDCLIGVSGGKDSCYAAYVLKKQNMNPLACTFDNGFMTERALNNIKNTVKNLSMDHVFVHHNSDYLSKYYKHFILTSGEFCRCVMLVFRLLYIVRRGVMELSLLFRVDPLVQRQILLKSSSLVLPDIFIMFLEVLFQGKRL